MTTVMAIIFQVVTMVVGILFMIIGSQEKDKFGRITDYTAGYLLLVLVIVVMHSIW